MSAILVSNDTNARATLKRVAALLFALLLTAPNAFSQNDTHAPAETPSNAATPASADELVVEGEQTSDVFGVGRSVRVRGTVKHGVLAFGGDVIVEGRVEGDVAAVGGSVVQREGSYIGGDVMVFGGAYHHGKTAPARGRDSKTVMFAGYEQELRELARNPTSILAPRMSLAFVGTRLLAVLFWFVVSLALTAVTPGAVSRAGARLQLTSLRVALIGLLAAVVLGPGVTASLRLLPPVLGVVVLATALLLLIGSYLFGRVVVHAATGRWLQRRLVPEARRSESLALLLGAAFWSIVLALPYVWPLLVTGLVIVSLGLSLTARYRLNWKRA
ncbi:MAG TPA: polymer-forming cytoskeletal protein [Pyrinomonadaceae bacterium]|nr:polymer-forming cytoskeletal protein [Pyrinomonadaceae bacterium]